MATAGWMYRWRDEGTKQTEKTNKNISRVVVSTTEEFRDPAETKKNHYSSQFQVTSISMEHQYYFQQGNFK